MRVVLINVDKLLERILADLLAAESKHETVDHIELSEREFNAVTGYYRLHKDNTVTTLFGHPVKVIR